MGALMFDVRNAARARRLRAAATVAVSAAVLACLAGPGSASTDAGTAVFSYTGGEQFYTVPAGVTVVRIAAIGGTGATGSSSSAGAAPGGAADQVQGDLPVTPGEQLFVEVGGSPGQPGAGGFNGGGDSRNGGGGGGGASDVRTCSRGASICPAANDTLTTRLLVAAGGGGGGSEGLGGTAPGGSGGAARQSGTWAGEPPFGANQGGPGSPGTASSGGDVNQENNVPSHGSPGSFGSGGAASTDAGQGGGGGGGGWFGGAAGGTSTDGLPGGGGGGGSSYAAADAQNVSIQIATSIAPSIAITPLTPEIELSQQSIAFPARQTGTASGAQALAITNSGAAPLYVTGLALGGVNPEDFAVASTTCGAAVAPSGTCLVTVRFSPEAGGVRRASLVVSAQGLADHAVALLGTGAVPASPLPAGIEACSGRARARTCTITFSAGAVGLARRPRVTSFTLRGSRHVVGGMASLNGSAVQLHRRTRVMAGRYVLTLWTTTHKHRQRLRTLAVQIM